MPDLDFFEHMTKINMILSSKAESMQNAMPKVVLGWSHNSDSVEVTLTWRLNWADSQPEIQVTRMVPEWLLHSQKIRETIDWMISGMLRDLNRSLGVSC